MTVIKTKDPITFEPKTFFGPEISALSWEDAEFQLELMKIKGSSILGKYVGEVSDTGDSSADWENISAYEKRNLN